MHYVLDEENRIVDLIDNLENRLFEVQEAIEHLHSFTRGLDNIYHPLN